MVDQKNDEMMHDMTDDMKDAKPMPPHMDKDLPHGPGMTPDKDMAPELETKLTFDESVLKKIVNRTSGEVAGVLSLEGGMLHDMTDFFRKNEDPTKGVAVAVDDDQNVKVELDATMRYGEDAPAVFAEVTKAIVRNVKEMTGMTVVGVSMHVKDMLTEEEIARQEDDADDHEESKDEARMTRDDKDLQPA
ncbi:Asp23/Gls24 family envelope stress response protein [Lacticaseibacillus mingshuiensis]|uniref:Stress response regulator gls24 homolog n=1 Tax=Lacticaseibacillus mingshuiensis TaxID=2799574 RepID=A0ABW4CIJ1_9LACO